VAKEIDVAFRNGLDLILYSSTNNLIRCFGQMELYGILCVQYGTGTVNGNTK
jgi:hypothetical protein